MQIICEEDLLLRTTGEPDFLTAWRCAGLLGFDSVDSYPEGDHRVTSESLSAFLHQD